MSRRAAQQPGRAGRTGSTSTTRATVTSLASVRRRDPLTVALVGSRCWVADALAAALAAGGDRVVRPAGHDEDGAGAGCGADVVVHLAAGPQEVSLRGQSEPALQTLAALHAARVDGARLVVVSLPGNAARLPADEALAAGFRSAHDVQTAVVELTECYGPGMPGGRTGTLARMLHQALADGVVVVEAGDEDEHRVCFVDDAVAGVVQVVRDGSEGRYRLAPPAGVRTLDLARAVAAATGTACRVRARRRLRVARVAEAPSRRPVDLGPGTVPDGWRCEVELVDGLARCLPATGTPAPATVDGGVA